MNSRLAIILKNLFAIACVAALIYLVDPKELWATLSQLTWVSVFYLAFVAVLLIYVSALKWKLFLQQFTEHVSVVSLFGLYLVGYFVNLILPSYLGGDFVRSWYVGKHVGQHEALSATILERYTGIVAMAALALSFMWFAGNVTPQIKIAVVVFALAVVAVSIIGASPRAIAPLERFSFLRPITKHLRKIQDGFTLARKNHALFAKALALSFVYHTLTVANTVAAAYAVGWFDPPIWQLFIVLPLILVVGSIPLSPNGLGIQEGAFVYFLTNVGATPAQALALSLVLRAKSYILALSGGVVWLKIRKQHPQS